MNAHATYPDTRDRDPASAEVVLFQVLEMVDHYEGPLQVEVNPVHFEDPFYLAGLVGFVGLAEGAVDMVVVEAQHELDRDLDLVVVSTPSS